MLAVFREVCAIPGDEGVVFDAGALTVEAILSASDMSAQTYVGETVSPRTAASFIDLIYETATAS
jgi:hypothetical protein